MEDPLCPKKSPYYTQVEAGKTYYWCSCGKSMKQPFCDGAHKGGAFSPLKWTAEKDETLALCGCKKTKSGALCDGSHLDF